jgi:hypothetical protein
MDEDPVNPSLEAIDVPELRESSPGENEGVLQGVLGEAGIAQDPEGDRVERVADLVHQDGERLAVTPSGLFDEVSIHLDLRLSQPEWSRSTLLTEASRQNVQLANRLRAIRA